MPNPNQINGQHTAAETLSFLAGSVQPTKEIDERSVLGLINPYDVLMTSMGNNRSAVFTPYYDGIAHAPKFRDRIERAQMFQRPFVEAMINYSARRLHATVTLRYLLDGGEGLDSVLETTWGYPLHDDAERKEVWDVVAAIDEAADDGRGSAVPARTGVVDLTERNMDAKRATWQLTTVLPPDETAQTMSQLVLGTDFIRIAA